MLTDDEVAELAALRARAFGPDADLTDDAAGLARLAELESRAHAPLSDGETARTRGADAAPSPLPAESAAPSASTSIPDESAVSPAPRAASESSGQARSTPARRASATAPSDAAASSDQALPPSSTSAGDAPGPAAPRSPRSPRRTWSRRAVLLVGIPIVAVACAVGAGAGAVAASQTAGTTPSPSTTLAAAYVASLRSVSQTHTWDEGSPRLLGDLDRTLVWGGTTAGGSVTCVVVDNVPGGPISTCQATDALTTSGVGVSISDPRSEAVRTYVAWPNGSPTLTYSTDDPNPSP